MLNLPKILRKAVSTESPQQSSGLSADPASVPQQMGEQPPVLQIAAESSDEVAELDRLYQQALDAMEAVESELNRTNELLHGKSDDDIHAEAASAGASNNAAALSISTAQTQAAPKASVAVAGVRATPAQIIEAALFVGGNALTIKRLCTLLKGEFDQDFIEATVEQLNRQYAEEHRPYEIRFGTGGYRMELNESFAAVQNRVFGIGPKDVKLSQEALEVLSLVAYKQPVTKEVIDAHVKETGGNILRQLLQRELVSLRRDSGEGNEITYHTTPRFLQVFGLADLSELPQSEELSFK